MEYLKRASNVQLSWADFGNRFAFCFSPQLFFAVTVLGTFATAVSGLEVGPAQPWLVQKTSKGRK